jgi:hypothetical protein
MNDILTNDDILILTNWDNVSRAVRVNPNNIDKIQQRRTKFNKKKLTLIVSRGRKAYKNHKCNKCDKTIIKGSNYISKDFRSPLDHRIINRRYHEQCDR